MIRFRSVSKSFEGRRGGVAHAVRDVSLDVAEGECVALVGASGSGKTTLLRLVNRMVAPTAGTVEVDGADVATLVAVALRRRTGYVVQRGGLFPHLTVAENVGLLARLAGRERAWIEARVTELLRLVDLDPAEVARRHPHELSGGQAQRAGVARALVLDPPVLLMDEPFGALDPITRREVRARFLALRRADRPRTTLVVTHDLEEAFALGDRVALLDAGRLVATGTRGELERSDDVAVRAFLASSEVPDAR